MPPYYLQALLHTIESVVVKTHEEFPKLHDAKVEWAYEQLLKYYKSYLKQFNENNHLELPDGI